MDGWSDGRTGERKDRWMDELMHGGRIQAWWNARKLPVDALEFLNNVLWKIFKQLGKQLKQTTVRRRR